MNIKCRTCGVEKASTFFWKQASSKLGYQTECKPCMRDRHNSWRAANRERARYISKKAQEKSRRRDPLRALLVNARARSKKNGCEFDLSVNDLQMPEACPVLGIPLISSMGTGSGRFTDNSPSVDRIDNSRGYTKDNVVIVSWRANRIKGDATPEELMLVAEFYRDRAFET